MRFRFRHRRQRSGVKFFWCQHLSWSWPFRTRSINVTVLLSFDGTQWIVSRSASFWSCFVLLCSLLRSPSWSQWTRKRSRTESTTSGGWATMFATISRKYFSRLWQFYIPCTIEQGIVSGKYQFLSLRSFSLFSNFLFFSRGVDGNTNNSSRLDDTVNDRVSTGPVSASVDFIFWNPAVK